MKRVRLSKNAADYLRREANFLRQRNAVAARAFALSMKNAQRLLQEFPEVGNRSHGLQISGGLTLVAGDYLLDYLCDEEEVHLLVIRHGRMLPSSPVVVDEDEQGDDSDSTGSPEPQQ